MSVLSGIKKVLKNPCYIIPILNHFHLLNWMSDEMFIKLQYRALMGRRLDLNFPQLFTEKLQWLKLNDRNPENTIMVDKYEFRKYISEKIGDEYLIPLLGVWDRFEDIDFSLLPNEFVLKCTHDSGGVVICRDKSKFDFKAAQKKITKCFKNNYYWRSREYPYKDVQPRIICEKYMVDESGVELKDYKVFCFNGEPKFIQVLFNRFIGLQAHIYDLKWQLIPVEWNYYSDYNLLIKKPEVFDKMLEISKKLSNNYIFLRVDFYVIDQVLYIGELTFYPASGFIKYKPVEYDAIFGEFLNLPAKPK